MDLKQHQCRLPDKRPDQKFKENGIFPHTHTHTKKIHCPEKPSEVYRLTRSGYLSLSNRIARGTKPLSLYDSTPVGD